MSLMRRFPTTSVLDQFDRFFDDTDLFAPFFGEKRRVMATPTVNITEDDKAYVIKMDIPGVDKKDVSVEVRDKQLVISGERKEDNEEKEGSKVIRRESFYGKFERSWHIDEDMVDVEKIKAKYVDGVFVVELPKTKKEAKKTKVIHVE